MEQMQFERQMERLYSCFNKSQSEKQTNDWYRDLRYHSEKALEHAVDYVRKHEQYFPSLSVVMALTKQYAPMGEKQDIECKYCDMGLIFTIGTLPIKGEGDVVERSNSVTLTFRCPVCKQSDLRTLPFYPQVTKSGNNIFQFRGGYYRGDISTVIWPEGAKLDSDIISIPEPIPF